MKLGLFLLITVLSKASTSQYSLKIFDISQSQIRLMKKSQPLDSLKRSEIFKDSIYIPYKEFWEGYLGNGDAVAEWMNNAMQILPKFEERNNSINGKKLITQFREVEKKMILLTGYKPKGKWYIVYGPGWTDLGGLGDFAMLIDLSHQSNSSNEKIMKMFPHELTHQIMTNVNKHKDTTAISAIIGEGFAVWMNKKYWGAKYSIAENLGYEEAEFSFCEKNIEKLKKYLFENKYSANKETIESFRNRGVKLGKELPGAIGYYLGYKIIEAYVLKFGLKSWKDIFIKSPREIYELSGFENNIANNMSTLNLKLLLTIARFSS